MLDDSWFSDPTTHVFYRVLDQRRLSDPRVAGIYRQRLDAANLKLRFAAQALRGVAEVLHELEHGEFIHFDDANRLKAHFNLEACVVFLRAALDTTVAGYATYFSGKTDTDSINEVFKKWPPAWIQNGDRPVWEDLLAAHACDEFAWTHALVGRDKGMSLRDLAVHKRTVWIDTIIDGDNRGRFVIELNKDTCGPAGPWLGSVFDHARKFVFALRDQIEAAEAALSVPNNA